MRGQLAMNQAGIEIDGHIYVAVETGVRSSDGPWRCEAVGKIRDFDRGVLERKIVEERKIVDDNIEQTVMAFPRNADVPDDILHREMPVRVILRPPRIYRAHGIGDGHSRIEGQQHWRRPREESDRLFCHRVGAVR